MIFKDFFLKNCFAWKFWIQDLIERIFFVIQNSNRQKKFSSKSIKTKNFYFKNWCVVIFLNQNVVLCFSSPKQCNIKEAWEECTVFKCLKISGVCLFVVFFVVRLMMALMVLPFALPLYIFENIWVAESDKLLKV